MVHFDSRYHVVGRMPIFPPAVVREEQTFQSRSISWIREQGGPIARAFVAAMPEEWRVDTTVCTCLCTYLKKGWRARGMGNFHTHGRQPPPGATKYHRDALPFLVAIAGNPSLTRVCDGSLELPAPPPRTLFRWRAWDPAIRALIERGEIAVRTVEEGALVLYGFGDFHTGQPAQQDGWRVFLGAWPEVEGDTNDRFPTHCVDNAYAPHWPSTDEAWSAFDPYRLTEPPGPPDPAIAHDSGYTLLAPLAPAPGDDPSGETPLFAADRQFAAREGGPLTRRFLDALPEEWKATDLVIDSFLVWLQPGRVPGWDQFHFEPFPGQYEGARALANRETSEHISWCFSDDAAPELLVGPVRFTGEPPDLDEYWSFCTNLHRRHRVLQAMVDAGTLAIERIPPFTPFRHGWGDFLRSTPAARSGFHFRIRATRGSLRPFCNALRNFESVELPRI